MATKTVTPALDARRRLLQAAERLFAEKGYAATSVQEITEAADVNKALLYYYFEDKHSLYMSLLDDGVAEFSAVLDRAMSADGSYTDRLRAFVAGHTRLMWRRQDLLRVVHRAMMSGDMDRTRLEEKFEPNLDRLEAFVREAMEAGEFRAVDAEMAARSIVGITISFACCQVYHGEEYDEDRVIDHTGDLLMHGLRAA